MNEVEAWHFFTTYNLSNLYERLDFLNTHASDYLKMIRFRRLFNIYDDLIRIVDSVPPLPQTRWKREGKYFEGLFSWIGSIASWVLGIATQIMNPYL